MTLSKLCQARRRRLAIEAAVKRWIDGDSFIDWAPNTQTYEFMRDIRIISKTDATDAEIYAAWLKYGSK